MRDAWACGRGGRDDLEPTQRGIDEDRPHFDDRLVLLRLAGALCTPLHDRRRGHLAPVSVGNVGGGDKRSWATQLENGCRGPLSVILLAGRTRSPPLRRSAAEPPNRPRGTETRICMSAPRPSATFLPPVCQHNAPQARAQPRRHGRGRTRATPYYVTPSCLATHRLRQSSSLGSAEPPGSRRCIGPECH